MSRMTRAYWSQVKASGLAVPEDRPLAELTTELTTMLGSPDPHMRDGLAYPTLATWVDRGVYDDLIAGLGDGMCAGLTVGLGEHDTDSVFRRAFSVLVLAECIDRDNEQGLLPGAQAARVGRPRSPPGTSASATCAASCPARAGRTPSPTAPTRSASWPVRPTSAATSSRCCSTSSATACWRRSSGRTATASPTGWRWPR